MFMDITSIDLFDQNVGMACANVRLISSCKSMVLIYLIKMLVWYVPMLDSGVHGCSWMSLALIYLIKKLQLSRIKLVIDNLNVPIHLIYLPIWHVNMVI